MHGFAGRPEDPQSFGPLHELLEAQSYRIADWRVAAEEINYRRFFNINDLAGLRMELPELFEKTHRLIFSLIDEGRLQGLRIDHIDGLFDPQDYCERLQQRSGAPLYVLVEKILARYEMLPDWPVAGTTGYDFVNQVLAIFIDPAGEAAMTRLYRRFTARRETFDDVLYACKKRIMQVNLASEMNVVAREFHQLAMRDRRTRDFTLNGMLGGDRGGRRGVPDLPHLCLAARRQRRRPPLYRLGDRAGAQALERRRDQHLRLSARRS